MKVFDKFTVIASIVWILILIVCLNMCSCKEVKRSKGAVFNYEDSNEVYTLTYDNCEYVINKRGQSQSITHKGNCKNHLNK